MEETGQLVNQYPAFAAIFAVVLVVVLVLVGLVINQNRKIQDLQKPKYGFLGKPLAAFFAMAFLIGGAGFVFYTNNQQTDVPIASADLTAEINIVATEVDPILKQYRFNMVPVVNGVEWGGTSAYLFDSYWTITNSTAITDIELALTLNNKGGITKVLQSGTNSVKVSVFVQDKNFEKEIVVDVE